MAHKPSKKALIKALRAQEALLSEWRSSLTRLFMVSSLMTAALENFFKWKEEKNPKTHISPEIRTDTLNICCICHNVCNCTCLRTIFSHLRIRFISSSQITVCVFLNGTERGRDSGVCVCVCAPSKGGDLRPICVLQSPHIQPE